MLRDRLGPDSVSFLIDHPAQLENLRDESESAQHPIHVFIKVDAGYHRAGVAPGSKQLKDLLQALETSSHVQVIGLYAHMVSHLSPFRLLVLQCPFSCFSSRCVDTAF